MPKFRRRPSTAPLCPACGSDKVRIVLRVEQFNEPDVQGDFKDEITQCDDCGQEIFTFDQAEAHSRAYAAAVARARNTLDPARIHALRMTLGKTQPEMEDAFGIGPKTWGRWERGVVAPSGPAARLLWFAENDPAGFLRMVEANKPGVKSRKVVGSIAQLGPGSGAIGFTSKAKPLRRTARSDGSVRGNGGDGV